MYCTSFLCGNKVLHYMYCLGTIQVLVLTLLDNSRCQLLL